MNQRLLVTLVDQILAAKQKDPNADTSALENAGSTKWSTSSTTSRRKRLPLWREEDEVESWS